MVQGVNPALAADLNHTTVNNDELQEQLRQQALATRPVLEKLMGHEGGPLRLKHKEVGHLRDHIITSTHIAMTLEAQLKAVTEVLAAQEMQLQELREKGQIWTPPTPS